MLWLGFLLALELTCKDASCKDGAVPKIWQIKSQKDQVPGSHARGETCWIAPRIALGVDLDQSAQLYKCE